MLAGSSLVGTKDRGPKTLERISLTTPGADSRPKQSTSVASECDLENGGRAHLQLEATEPGQAVWGEKRGKKDAT